MTQNATILAHLQSGKTITPLEALEEFQCFRLGARIHELKQDGHKIVSERHTTPSGKNVSCYRMAD